MVNARQKGARGEREIVHLLNGTIEGLMSSQEWPEDVVSTARSCIQRNQNQTAVGGSDLSNVFGLAVEIKRCEKLLIEQWWIQCVSQAKRNNEHPVLLYRQSNNPWRCITLGHAPLPGGRMSSMRVQFEEDAFVTWFYQWVYYKMIGGDLPRI